MPRSVLIVEDEFLVRLELEQALAKAGWAIAASVGSVARALAAIAVYRFDAALVDIKLGDESSHAVMDALTTEGIPFIVMTGYATDNFRREHQHCTLTKPFRMDDLIGGLDRLAA